MGYFKNLAIGIEHEGWDAAARNVPVENCPYPMGAPERGFWMEGHETYTEEFNDWLDRIVEGYREDMAA